VTLVVTLEVTLVVALKVALVDTLVDIVEDKLEVALVDTVVVALDVTEVVCPRMATQETQGNTGKHERIFAVEHRADKVRKF